MFYLCSNGGGGRQRLVCSVAVVLLSFCPLQALKHQEANSPPVVANNNSISSLLTRRSDNNNRTGTYILAAAVNNSSTKSDAIWATTTEINIDSHNWSTIANFSTGRYLAAVNDYGVTWTSNNNAGAHNWYVNYYMI